MSYPSLQKPTLSGPFEAFGKYRSLTLALSKRELLGRYRGATFGLFWSLISPFLMLGVYTFAFGYIMKSRWPHTSDSTGEYALILFVGLIIHGYFAECLIRSPTLIVGNPNLVKRIIFPLEILPWPMVLSALFHVAANFIVFSCLHLVFKHYVPWTIIFLPVVLAPFVLFTMGVSWFMASLGVYIRDIPQVTGVIATAMLFLSSAIIPVDSLPPQYRLFFAMNPLSFIINQAREVALWGNVPDFFGLALYAAGSFVVAYLGYAWFLKTKRGFADVI
ncbi:MULTISPECIES: ABC transporter permease [unclassified Luteibacter]|uniref:ABC transporter permease n=1 Tax=unclassified Luteibacter TaxID=2620188 RepID=UPI000A56A1EE|nr:ABC transporter permease [Luteibacter sp. 9135]